MLATYAAHLVLPRQLDLYMAVTLPFHILWVAI
jgi:hypothetical protein